MWLDSAVITHQGRVREKNEDNFYYLGFTLADAPNATCYFTKPLLVGSEPTLFAVFDGMGGMSAGDKASHLAATAAKAEQASLRDTNATALMNRVCARANADICQDMIQNAQKRMGTTAAMMAFQDDRYSLCNIGDSPIYIRRQNQLCRLSAEHSEREMYEKVSGPAKPGQKFRLTQHLGIFPEEMTIEPFNSNGPVAPGDMFLICSDGLTDMVDPVVINNILGRSPDIGYAVKALMSAALKNGGRDNITIIGIEAEGPRWQHLF